MYVIKGLTEWLPNWKKRGFRTSTGKPVLNQDLWELLDAEMNCFAPAEVSFAKVKGHSNIEGNEEADRLANQGCRSRDRLHSVKRLGRLLEKAPPPGGVAPETPYPGSSWISEEGSWQGPKLPHFADFATMEEEEFVELYLACYQLGHEDPWEMAETIASPEEYDQRPCEPYRREQASIVWRWIQRAMEKSEGIYPRGMLFVNKSSEADPLLERSLPEEKHLLRNLTEKRTGFLPLNCAILATKE